MSGCHGHGHAGPHVRVLHVGEVVLGPRNVNGHTEAHDGRQHRVSLQDDARGHAEASVGDVAGELQIALPLRNRIVWTQTAGLRATQTLLCVCVCVHGRTYMGQ